MATELYDLGVEVDVEIPGRGTYPDIADTLLQETD